MSFQIL